MFINRLMIVLLATLLCACTPTTQLDKEYALYGYSSLEKAILNSVHVYAKDAPNDAGGLLILLGHIDSAESRNLLIRLAQVYVGSATSEALTYSITRQGKKILPALKMALNSPVSCVDQLEPLVISCLSVESRNRIFQRYIKLIESGKIIEYVM